MSSHCVEREKVIIELIHRQCKTMYDTDDIREISSTNMMLLSDKFISLSSSIICALGHPGKPIKSKIEDLRLGECLEEFVVDGIQLLLTLHKPEDLKANSYATVEVDMEESKSMMFPSNYIALRSCDIPEGNLNSSIIVLIHNIRDCVKRLLDLPNTPICKNYMLTIIMLTYTALTEDTKLDGIVNWLNERAIEFSCG